MDNGNFMKHAAVGLRDYCNVDATAYIANPPTYVNIPDKTIKKLRPPDFPDADVYLLNDHTYFYHYRHFKDKPRIVKCNGTFARDMGDWFMGDYLRHGTLLLSSPCDYSLASALPFSIQTIGPLYDHRLLPEPAFSKDKIMVGHAPTNPHKGTQHILNALHKYRKNGTIDIDIITDTPWTEAIQRKAHCHIFIDQYTVQEADTPGTARGAFGINAIESLDLGSLVMTNPLHPYVIQHLPRHPLYTFPEHLTQALTSIGEYTARPETHSTPEWTRYYFDLYYQAPRLLAWIKYVTQGQSSP